jgi:dienelactone hydrolase
MNKLLRNIIAGLGMMILAVTASYAWYFKDTVFAESQSFALTQSVLLPYMEVLTPDTEEPRPAVLLFHGCGGPRDYGLPRAQYLVEQGYVAVLIDSYTGRGVDWELSCAGRVLPGSQRAADVLVALDFARQHPAIDGNQLFVMGYSHGGWTILEALANGDELPPGLIDSPGDHLRGLRGLIAWYPYCGFAAEYTSGWDSDTPVLMLLAAEDNTTAAEPCVDIARHHAAQGKPVTWQVYPGVDHGFDVQEDWVRVYDPEVHRQALQEQSEFLSRYSDDPAQ